jgi:hypothetical protein
LLLLFGLLVLCGLLFLVGLLVVVQACQFVPSRTELMRMLGVNGCSGLMFAGLDKPRH